LDRLLVPEHRVLHVRDGSDVHRGRPHAALVYHGIRVPWRPEITTHQAIAAALFLETAAFTIGIYR
jgi:hypothetical protein